MFEDLEDSLAGSDSLNTSDLEDKVTPVSSFQTQIQNGEIPNISSIETLLLNIQGLLKVAAENARHHERQLSIEKSKYMPPSPSGLHYQIEIEILSSIFMISPNSLISYS